MKNFYVIVFLCLFSYSAFAFETVSIPTENSFVEQKAEEKCPISDEEFSELEKIILKKTYSKESPQKRISRLEKEIFGMEQKGNYEDRFDNLLTASDYYKSGYRQGENIAQGQQKSNIHPQELNSKNYIKNYNFDDIYDDVPEQKYYAQNKPQNYYYDEDYEAEQKPKQKQSKIKQFFSDLVDVLSAGVVTGYTPSINSYGFDPFDTFTNIGGSNFIGLPQSPSGVYVPRMNNNYYNSYVPRRYYAPPPPRHRYNGYPLPPPRRTYNSYYRNPVPQTYNSGAGVRILH